MQHIGRYRIVREIGRGAMGVVYQAEDPAIGRTVAIKTIRLGEASSDQEREFLRARLLREARSAGALSHPGIVTIYDVQEHDGVGYVFMEFVDGPSLEKLIAAGEPIEKNLLLDILAQTAEALDYAHGQGVVHRDIKPANILLAPGGRAKITDFGVAKFASHQATQSGVVLGTPSYMSPEQISDQGVSGRSDQFSLAVIAYLLLTGERPFSASTIPSLMFKIVNEEPAPPQRLNPTLGNAVELVLRKALHKDPSQRYATCSDFMKALRGACQTRPDWQPMRVGMMESLETLAQSQLAAAARRTPAPVVGAASTSAVPHRPLTRRLPWIAFTASLLLIAGALFWWRHDRLRPPQPQTAGEPPELAASLDAGKPSPTGPQVETPAAAAPAQSTRSPEQEAAPEPPTVSAEEQAPAPAAPQPEKPRQSAQQSLPPIDDKGLIRVVTSPPGARIVFDGQSSLACLSPCERLLSAGRHTLAATKEGYRSESRILRIPEDRQLLIPLERAMGTLVVRSTPPGATIVLNGQQRLEKTPALLTLAVGHYQLELLREGRRQQHTVEIKDSVVTNVDVNWEN